MNSYEDRIRAVELYIKLGQRGRPTTKQLGHPTKNALKGWYREYQQHLVLPARYAGRDSLGLVPFIALFPQSSAHWTSLAAFARDERDHPA